MEDSTQLWMEVFRRCLARGLVTSVACIGDNTVVDAIKLILLNYSNFSIAKIVVKKIERVK